MTRRTKARQSKPKIFLTYAQEDQPVAERVEAILANATQDSIVVGQSPRMGQVLGSEVRRQFGDSDLYVLVLTPHALDSDRAQVELGAAWALEKPTLVVVSDLEPDLQVPLLAGLEVARVSVDELERPGVVEGILHRIGRESERVA
jgi:hypothetical protein